MKLLKSETPETEKKKRFGSIIDPSLDDILKKIPTAFIAVNMVRKRCNQISLTRDNEQYITLASLITKIFVEITENKTHCSVDGD